MTKEDKGWTVETLRELMEEKIKNINSQIEARDKAIELLAGARSNDTTNKLAVAALLISLAVGIYTIFGK